MELTDILSPELTFCNVTGSSKKRVIETSAELIAGKTASLEAGQIYDALIAREQLGSTGLGNGIAIPHCRLAKCSRIVGTLIKLEQSVDFDAIDDKPVDLLFFLLVPENTVEEHLEALRVLAERFNNPEYCQALRAANSDAELYQAAAST